MCVHAQVDLVPKEVVAKWLKYLRRSFPAIAFKASTQENSSSIKQTKASCTLLNLPPDKLDGLFGSGLVRKTSHRFENAWARQSSLCVYISLHGMSTSSASFYSPRAMASSERFRGPRFQEILGRLFGVHVHMYTFVSASPSPLSSTKQGSADKAADGMLNRSGAVGTEALMGVLKNYCRSLNLKTAITVGVIGYPNVGKSSLINSLKRLV